MNAIDRLNGSKKLMHLHRYHGELRYLILLALFLLALSFNAAVVFSYSIPITTTRKISQPLITDSSSRSHILSASSYTLRCLSRHTYNDKRRKTLHSRVPSLFILGSLLNSDNTNDNIHPSLDDCLNLQQNSKETYISVSNHDMTKNGDRVSGSSSSNGSTKKRPDRELGGYDPSEGISDREINVGNPQLRVMEKDRSVTSILRELAAIQQQGPQKYCILGTRHCSYLHQQIIELLAYALVLSDNHVYTSGAGGTHAATIRGALRAGRSDLLTVVLPQSLSKQTQESQELLKRVQDIVEMPQNDDMSLDLASRICNSYLLNQADQLISFAFHESTTVIEATKEAKKLDMLVTVLYLD